MKAFNIAGRYPEELFCKMCCGIKTLFKNLPLSSNSLFCISSTCREGTMSLRTSGHSKLKQQPVKTNPGQGKHIKINFFKIYWQMEILQVLADERMS